MERPSIVRNIMMILVISACIAFFPILYLNDDTTGGGGAAFLMCATIPAGVAFFLLTLLISIRSHKKSLADYNEWKSEGERLTIDEF